MAVGAFFDMDYTLLAGSSGLLYLRWLRRTRRLSAARWGRIMYWVARYMAGLSDFPHMMARLTAQSAGTSEAEAWRLSYLWFEEMLSRYIAPGGRERIAWHREKGHHPAIVSAATPYVVRLVADALGLGEAYVCTRLEVDGGSFTGCVIEPACYGPGKVTLTQLYAAERGLDLAQSYFYSDSASDLPLLEAVGHPVAVNPNRKLARIAAERGWPVMRFY